MLYLLSSQQENVLMAFNKIVNLNFQQKRHKRIHFFKNCTQNMQFIFNNLRCVLYANCSIFSSLYNKFTFVVSIVELNIFMVCFFISLYNLHNDI